MAVTRDLNPTARWLVRYWRQDKPFDQLHTVQEIRAGLQELQVAGRIDQVAARVRNGSTVGDAIYAEKKLIK